MTRSIITADSAPKPRPDIVDGHTLSMLVNNQPGVLMRVCQIFARRGYNIDSLVVSNGRDPRFSRMTIGLSGDPAGLWQIILQCDKLIDVIHCHEHTPANAIVRELVLIKLSVLEERRAQVLQVVEHFAGKTVDFTEESMVVMVTGTSEKIDAALRMFSTFDVIETVRTGKVVMARGEEAT